jgi:hypothetical protein
MEINSATRRALTPKAPLLRADHYDAWTRHGQSACPVMAIPSAMRIDSLGGGTSAANRLRGLGYTTLFWLPATDPDLPSTAATQLGVNPVTSTVGKGRLLTFLGQEVSVVLPFLRTLKSISVLEANSQLASVSLTEKELNIRGSDLTRTSTLTSTGTTRPGRREFFQVGTRCAIPPDVKRDPQTPLAARYLPDIAITLAVELLNGQPASLRDAPFYVYFPTEDPTGAGFIVHADFHVEPHRKHLMSGALNDWVLKEAARLAAGTFLTEILRRFAARAAFEALAPSSESSRTPFLEAFARELQSRKHPFVPTVYGPAEAGKAILAPRESQAVYFETELAESLNALRENTWLVSAAVDSARSRSFLKLANVRMLPHDSMVELVEHAGTSKIRNVEWWLRAYRQLASDPLVSTRKRDFFVGRRLVPGEKDVLAVPSSGEAELCLPPARARKTHVPAVFTSVFAFVEEALAAQLDYAEDETAAWARDRFGISRFEASDLLPRAVRAVVGQLFSGERRVTRPELVELWRFIRTLSSTSRMQTADDVWLVIGRLPLLPQSEHHSTDTLEPKSLVPAFLLYWPDDYIPGEAWIHGLSLQRVDPKLLKEIADNQWSAEWMSFFGNIGVSSSPKLLEYTRMPGLPEVPLSSHLPFTEQRFSGERQRDENYSVLRILRGASWWSTTLNRARQCGHSPGRVLQSIHVIDGLMEAAAMASAEHAAHDENWKVRLDSLCRRVAPLGSGSQLSDSAYCRGGGGHLVELPGVVRHQTSTLPWLPSSRGPASLAQCFLRQPTHRIISGAVESGELNDAILPFVVADDLNLFAGLSRAGMRVLETVRGPSADVLVALNEIGATLSTPWGKEQVLGVPARWRAVRGAIQEIFRSLNQFETVESVPFRFLPARTSTGLEFVAPPLWYAEPGVLRDAFSGVLPLLDADRSYPQLFEHAGITALTPGDSVTEELTFPEEPRPADNLHSTIRDQLGPYLIAVVASRSEAQNEVELSTKRLKERFAVSVVSVIRLAFVLASNPRIRVEYSAGKFYLQRRVLERRGAIEEAHFNLYKRRLLLPGGWAGLTFKQDVRSPGCGYDFVAESANGTVRLEVKTFTANGRVMFTSRELHEAAIEGSSYFLVGILDDAGPERSWKTFLLQNPLVDLLRIGTFAFEARLQLTADQLFEVNRGD